MALDVTYPGAFLAGLLSFFSPCVLPLVPPYLCFLGGVSYEQLREQDHARRARIVQAALAFVLGFTTVFVALGSTASLIGRAIATNFGLLGTIAGLVIVALGLHFLGVFRIPWLQREARLETAARPATLAGSYLVGLAFAFGWTPCVGPVLASILIVAGGSGGALEGAALLAIYSLGIGVPFLAAAVAARWFLGAISRGRRAFRYVEAAMGALLVAAGILIMTGTMADIGTWLLDTFPALGRLG